MIDASGANVDSYTLEGPAMVCAPLPAVLRSNIPSIGLVSVNENGAAQLNALTSWVRVSPNLIVCGNLSVLPAVIAASIPGSPTPLPTATPEPAPSLPVTGGNALTSSLTFGWILLAGIVFVAFAAIAMSRQRVRASRKIGTRD